jgi:NADH-quinone oxidoreductase subunit J
VFARHNAVDTPALLPDGSTSEISVSRVLTARGTMKPAPSGDVDLLTGSMGDGTAYRPVTGSGPRGGIDGDPADRSSTDRSNGDEED